MTQWTTTAEIRERAERLWQTGKLLQAAIGGDPVPLGFNLRRPSGSMLTARFAEAQAWARALEADAGRHGFALRLERVQHQTLGGNDIPVGVHFADLDALARFIGKRKELQRFLTLHEVVDRELPEARSWLIVSPHEALSHADVWPRLQAVVTWLAQNPRPRLYLRQLEVAGVDTKFIEQHKTVLAKLFDLLLPPEAIDGAHTRGVGFEARYGFREKPPVVRFRILDPNLALAGLTDLSVPVEQFAALKLPVRRVYLTENDINGLAFPNAPNALVIFGLGYSVDRLAAVSWLGDVELHYWGDIDTHGFAILDRLRAHFPGARSILMTRDVLMLHKDQWAHEERPERRDLARLTPEEAQLYNDLRADRLGKGVRLEQERVSLSRLRTALKSHGLR